MNPAPGYTVTIGERPAVSLVAPAASNGFMVGWAAKPSADATLCLSLTDFVEKLGGQITGFPNLYNAVDTFFREGGGAVYVGSIIVDTGVKATKKLVDTGGKNAIEAIAAVAGEWGNKLKIVATLASSKTTVAVYYDGALIATSPALESNAAIQAWSEANVSDYVLLKNLNTSEAVTPKSATSELTGGDDKRGEFSDEDLAAALATLNADLGPGQVAAPGFTGEAEHESLMAHAATHNRRFLLDLSDLADPAELVAKVTAVQDAPEGADRFGAALAPWAKVPGINGGGERTVPYSAVQMGMIARAEANGYNPNQAVAGKKRGTAQFATGLTQVFTDAQRATLNNGGVIAATLVRGAVTTFGNVTCINQTLETNWRSFSGSRTVMFCAAATGEVLQDFEFDQIDGLGHIFGDLAGQISGRACMPLYLDNALYGTTPAEAFAIATGADVNTPKSIAAEELKVQIAIRTSPNGERLSAEIVKVPITEGL